MSTTPHGVVDASGIKCFKKYIDFVSYAVMTAQLSLLRCMFMSL
jgi:hypothetical protein